ncbi:MAG: AAA family ATPase [Verrucomicrobiales bacterium]
MIASLMRPEAYGHAVDEIKLLETHISWVLLTGRFAYKLKKPVNLGFVDFSTLDRRRWFCEEELRLNRRLAADLYLGVSAVHGPAGHASFVGDGSISDWAVRMSQFPQEALLAEALAAGRVDTRHWIELAQTIAQFQASAAVAGDSVAGTEGFGTAVAVRQPAQANLDVLERCPAAQAAWPALREWTAATGEALSAEFERRRRDGRVREGHGDLHLGNMVLLDDGITVFDCLEFNPGLRWIDVISELAFLVMDLAEHGRALDGARLLNHWLDRTGDYTGLVMWRWYVVYRALVRAKVSALRLTQAGATAKEAAAGQSAVHAYLSLARTTIEAPTGQLVITHGVSGSGKSHLARHLCHRLGWIHLRSDAERKRLFGAWGIGGRPSSTKTSQATATDMYRPEVTDQIYEEVLPAQALAVLRAGFSIIVDATSLKRHHRQAMAAVAQRCGARFRILDCRVDETRARQRIETRRLAGLDPSDATADVLAHQWTTVDPLDPDERAAALVVEPDANADSIAAQL